MTRAEIKDGAKQLVLRYGPWEVLGMRVSDVGGAYVARDATPEVRAAVLDEARKQARRIYRFLDYEAPFPAEIPMIQRGDM